MSLVVMLLHRLIQGYILVVIVEVILSYFLSPFHPVRQFFSRLVDPLLTPIRRLMPNMGGLDFSPLILIVLLQILDMVLTNLLSRL